MNPTHSDPVVNYLTALQREVARSEPLVTVSATRAISGAIDGIEPDLRPAITEAAVRKALEGRATVLFEPITRAVALDHEVHYLHGATSVAGALETLIARVGRGRHEAHSVGRFMAEYHGDGGAARSVGLELRTSHDLTLADSMKASVHGGDFHAPQGSEFAFRFDHPEDPKQFSDLIIGRLTEGTWVIGGEAYCHASAPDHPSYPDQPLFAANVASLEVIEKAVRAYLAENPVPSAALLGVSGNARNVQRNFEEAGSLLLAVQDALKAKRAAVSRAPDDVGAVLAQSLKPNAGWISRDFAQLLTQLDAPAANTDAAQAAPESTREGRIARAHEDLRKALQSGATVDIDKGLALLNPPTRGLAPKIDGSEGPMITATFLAALTSTTRGADQVVTEMARRFRYAGRYQGDAEAMLQVLKAALTADRARAQAAVQAVSLRVHGIARAAGPVNWRSTILFDRRYTPGYPELEAALAANRDSPIVRDIERVLRSC